MPLLLADTMATDAKVGTDVSFLYLNSPWSSNRCTSGGASCSERG